MYLYFERYAYLYKCSKNMYLYFERYAIVHFHGIHTSGVIPVDSVTLTSKTGSFRNMAASLVRLLILQREDY